VNGQPILLSDFERQVAEAQNSLLEQGADPGTADGEAALAALRPQVLESMIDATLVEQAAVQLGIVLGAAEVDAQVRADVSAGGGSLAFAEWLTATGQTGEEYSAAVRASLLLQRVALAVTAGLPTQGEQVHLRRITVDSIEAVEGVLAQLQQGADFSLLAADLVPAAGASDDAGDMGWVPRGLIEPQAEAVVFALQPGGVTGAIALGNGRYALYQVVEHAADRPFSPDVQVALKTAAYRQWLAERRAKAEVERFMGQ
jgi:parvulin-like peptidyl-prolyl isomerase